MWGFIFGTSMVLFIVGVLIIIGSILLFLGKLYFKGLFLGIRWFLEGIGTFLFIAYDYLFVVKKGKVGVVTKNEFELTQEQKEKQKHRFKNDRESKMFLGAVNFVETLKTKYPNADSKIFEGMVDKLLQIKRPKELQEYEAMVSESHNKNTKV